MSQGVALSIDDNQFVLVALKIADQQHEITAANLRAFGEIEFSDEINRQRQRKILQLAGIELATLEEGGRVGEVVIDLTKVEPATIVRRLDEIATQIEGGNAEIKNWAGSYGRWQEVVDILLASKERHRNPLSKLIPIAVHAHNLRLVLKNIQFVHQSKDEIIALIQLGNEHLLQHITAQIENPDINDLQAFTVFEALARANPEIAEKFRNSTQGIIYKNNVVRAHMASLGHPATLEDLSKHPFDRRKTDNGILPLKMLADLYDARANCTTPSISGAVDLFGFSTLTLGKRYAQAIYEADLSADVDTKDFLSDHEFIFRILNQVGNKHLVAFLEKHTQKDTTFLAWVLSASYDHGLFRDFALKINLREIRENHGITEWKEYLFRYFARINHPRIVDELIFLYENDPDPNFLELCLEVLRNEIMASPRVVVFLAEKAKTDTFAFLILSILAGSTTHSALARKALREMDMSAYAHLNPEQRKLQIPASWKPIIAKIRMDIKDVWGVLVQLQNEGVYRAIADAPYAEPDNDLLSKLLEHPNLTSKAYIDALGRIAEYDITALEGALWSLQDPDKRNINIYIPNWAWCSQRLSPTEIKQVTNWARENFERAVNKNPRAVYHGLLTELQSADLSFHIDQVNNPSLGQLDEEDLHWKAIVHCSQNGNQTARDFINSHDEDKINNLIDSNPLWLVRAMDIEKLDTVNLVQRNLQRHPIAAFQAIAKRPSNELKELLNNINSNFLVDVVRNIPADQPQLADAFIKAILNVYSTVTRDVGHQITFHDGKLCWPAIEEAFKTRRGKFVRELVLLASSGLFRISEHTTVKTHEFTQQAKKLIIEIVETDFNDPDYATLINTVSKFDIRLMHVDFSRLIQAAKLGDTTAFSYLCQAIFLVTANGGNQILLDGAIDAIVAHPNLAMDLLESDYFRPAHQGIRDRILLSAAQQSLAVKVLLRDRNIHKLGNTFLSELRHPNASVAELFRLPNPAAASPALLSALLMAFPSFNTNEIDEPTLAAAHQIEVFDDSNQTTAATNVDLPLSVNLVNADNHDLESWRRVNLEPVERRDDDVEQRRNDVRRFDQLASLRQRAFRKNVGRARFVVS